MSSSLLAGFAGDRTGDGRTVAAIARGAADGEGAAAGTAEGAGLAEGAAEGATRAGGRGGAADGAAARPSS